MIETAPPELPDRVRAWAASQAPYEVVDVTALGGGITATK